jgi:cob(I)alamin adenosyltransferase
VILDEVKKSTRPKEGGAGSKVRCITSTKRGDRGRTRLLSGETVSKSSPRIEACGNVDESNAAMGLAKAFAENEKIRNIISTIQGELFLLGAELSCRSPRPNMKRVEQDHITQMEKWIIELQGEVPLERSFISPGANSLSAALDCARSVVRRTERSMVILREMGQLQRSKTLEYINRLGCLLYVMARYAEKITGL